MSYKSHLEEVELRKQELNIHKINEQVEQNKILFEQIFSQTENLEDEIGRLERYRQALIQESKEQSVNDCLFG